MKKEIKKTGLKPKATASGKSPSGKMNGVKA